MATVLYIKANAKPEGQSRTFQVSDAFINTYRESHPDDRIVTLDLYKEGIGFLSEESVLMHKPSPGEGRDHPTLKYAHQFREADKIVIAEPLWNLGIPAILKAYIDYITVNGITFGYTEQGPVGLCQGKKAINITARGGTYSSGAFADYEMGDRYLRTILGFLGIYDYRTLAAESLDVVGTDVAAVMEDAVKRAQEIARNF
jgi:FMN-dependent NADH-azoreductase